MAIGKTQALTADFGALRSWAVEVRANTELLTGHNDSVVRAVDTTMGAWRGSASDAARSDMSRLNDMVRKVIAAHTAKADAAESGAAAMENYQRVAREAITQAEAEQHHVGEDGSVCAADARWFLPDGSAAELTTLQRRLDESARGYEARIKPALAGLTEQDDTTTTAINAADAELPSSVLGQREPHTAEPPAPPDDNDPEANKKYWDGLSEAQRKEVIEDHPDWIGNRDGIPAQDRHDANVNRIDDERADLEQRRDELKNELDRNIFGGTFTNVDADLWYVEEKLKDMDTVSDQVAKNPDGKLLVLDTSGERTKAAFAIGNPDTAEHISVTTPGLNTTVNGSLAGMVGEARSLREEEEAALDAANTGRENQTVATVAWIGYEPPNTTGPGNFDTGRGLVDVTDTSKAQEGAAKLGNFYNGLDVASTKEDPHITAFGHSYGSLTTSLALQHDSENGVVDDVMFYGSPGLSDGTGDPIAGAEDLGLKPGHAYLAEADGDMVADSGIFGGDPSFGHFDNVSTKDGVGYDGEHRIGVTGHSEYPRVRTITEYNFAIIAAGLADEPGYLVR